MAMRNRYSVVVLSIAILALAVFGYIGCEKKRKNKTGSKTGSSATGTVTGYVVDADGQPLEGALVVMGENSPHTVTDPNGQFTISDVPGGMQKINVIAGGFYTLNNVTVSVLQTSATTNLGNVQVKEFSETLDNIPDISNTTASILGNTISITATVIEGSAGDDITDVRAELLYYNTGSVMTALGGNQYSATITIPSNAVGPYLSIIVFAVDEEYRVGSEIVTVSYSGGSGSGGFTLDTIAGQWSGSAKYHRDALDIYNYPRALLHRANATITVTDSSVVGKYAEPRTWLLLQGYSDPIETVSLDSGTVTLLDANLGIYNIILNYTGVSWTGSVRLLARCDSATNPENLSGMLYTTEIDSTSTPITRFFTGRFHFKKGESWDFSDLTSEWTLSDFFVLGTPFGTRYIPPFQYNEAFSIDVTGNVGSGSNTMGLDITGGNFVISDTSLGTFGGSIVTSDGITTSFYGLIDVSKQHVRGIKKITNGSSTVYGHFWGPKTPQPLFNISDFASIKPNGTVVNSIFKGFVFVTAGPNSDMIYPTTLRFDESGNIVGGFIFPLIVNITSGSVSFVSTTTGQFSGSATGLVGQTFTIAPSSSSRNASMGVYKIRIVGDFTLTTDAGTDSGYFFIHRRPE
jgi:hypothetical protein